MQLPQWAEAPKRNSLRWLRKPPRSTPAETMRTTPREATVLQPFHICADKDPSRRGLEATPEAVAVGFVDARRPFGQTRLEVCSPAPMGSTTSWIRSSSPTLGIRQLSPVMSCEKRFSAAKSAPQARTLGERANSPSTVFSSIFALPVGLNRKGSRRLALKITRVSLL